jgi:SAM-dependent methyltransferase
MICADKKEQKSSAEKMTAVREFWNDQAREHGAGLAATTPDPIAKELEISALARHLECQRDTLEIGCGNGANIFRLSSLLQGRIVGVDYADDMIGAAQSSLRELPAQDRARISFAAGDIMENMAALGVFPQIFTVRCLINLPSLGHQLQAMQNIADILEPGGRLVLIESVQQGQEKLNALREEAGLEPIAYHWHNLYLDQDTFLAGVPDSLRRVEIDNFASLYFVISRVFNAKLTPPGESPDYMAEINKIAAQLPSFGDHGPLKLFVFEKVESA